MPPDLSNHPGMGLGFSLFSQIHSRRDYLHRFEEALATADRNRCMVSDRSGLGRGGRATMFQRSGCRGRYEQSLCLELAWRESNPIRCRRFLEGDPDVEPCSPTVQFSGNDYSEWGGVPSPHLAPGPMCGS